jgi:hypothetical protein
MSPEGQKWQPKFSPHPRQPPPRSVTTPSSQFRGVKLRRGDPQRDLYGWSVRDLRRGADRQRFSRPLSFHRHVGWTCNFRDFFERWTSDHCEWWRLKRYPNQADDERMHFELGQPDSGTAGGPLAEHPAREWPLRGACFNRPSDWLARKLPIVPLELQVVTPVHRSKNLPDSM